MWFRQKDFDTHRTRLELSGIRTRYYPLDEDYMVLEGKLRIDGVTLRHEALIRCRDILQSHYDRQRMHALESLGVVLRRLADGIATRNCEGR